MLPDYEIVRKTKIEKILPILEFILVLLLIQAIISLFTPLAIEEEAVRFRILAHSNADKDQQIKMDIQKQIEPLIQVAIGSSTSKTEIGENMAAIESEILAVAEQLSKGKPVKLERTAALFPPKRSGILIAPQSIVDAYILTIGSGRGDNWWCALFPKVCFPEQEANADKDKQEEKEVKFFIWEWIKSFFN